MTCRRKLACGGKTPSRPKAIWGAIVGGLMNLAGTAMTLSAQKDAQNDAIRRQQQQTRENNLLQLNEAASSSINNMIGTRGDEYVPLEYKYGGKSNGKKKFSITDGGEKIPIGHNRFFLRGNAHTDVNEAGKTGIGIRYGNDVVEAEGGEVAYDNGKELKIYSDKLPIAGNLTPADLMVAGANPDKVFRAQEKVKKTLGITSPVGSRRKGRWGLSTVGSDWVNLGADAFSALGSWALSNALMNKINYNYELPSYVDETNASFDTTYHNEAQLAEVERNRELARRRIARNTASSATSLGRMQEVDTEAMIERNKLWDEKANKEVELRNKAAEIEQQVRARNAAAKNQYYQNVAELKRAQVDANNALEQTKLQNTTAMLSGLGTAVNNFITQGQQRYQDENALMAYLAASENGTAARLAASGYEFTPRVLNGLYNSEKTQYDTNPTRQGAERLNLFGSLKYGTRYKPVSTEGFRSELDPVPVKKTTGDLSFNPTTRFSIGSLGTGKFNLMSGLTNDWRTRLYSYKTSPYSFSLRTTSAV